MSPATDWPPFYDRKKRKLDTELLANLVNAAEIARRAGVKSPAVSNWVARGIQFPEPVVRLLYDWREVEAWLRATNRYPKPVAKPVGSNSVPHITSPIPDRFTPQPWRP